MNNELVQQAHDTHPNSSWGKKKGIHSSNTLLCVMTRDRYFTATASISTSAPIGNAATSKQIRAGICSEKCSA